ncbi:MAG: gp53-like domain-containing protein [Sphingobium phenoxybenzoativorans]
MALTLTVTNAGRAALVNAANTGTAPVTIAQIGLTGTAVVPNAAATVLPGEFKRLATLSGDVVADDTIHLIVRDESTDVFTVRSLAMYLADGTLFGIYGQAAVLVEKSAQALMLIAVDVKFEDITASAITFGNANFLNPPATTEMQGVVELATSTETFAGADTQRAVTPRAFGDALYTSLNFRFGLNNAGIWHPGNDGSGSGLDADLLDGQDGGYYTNIPARLGYSPLNKAGDTATGRMTFNANSTGNNGMAIATGGNGELEVRGNGTGAAMMTFHRPDAQAVYFGLDTDNNLKIGGWSLGAVAYKIWHAGNDGAGSGLDADLLDGQDSSYFTNIPARLGYTPANRGGDTFTGPIRRDANFYMDFAGSSPIVNFDALDYIGFDRASDVLTLVIGGAARMVMRGSGNIDLAASGGQLGFNGNLVWHAGNDGAGSGLDADLLDGQDSGYFTNIPARLGYTPANKGGDTFTGPICRDAGYYLNLGGSGPILNFDSADYFEYDRAADSLSLRIGGQQRLTSRLAGNLDLYAAGSIYFNSQAIWHSGNDGSGSGLDADLLDGQDGGYYTNIPARLGYTPANKAGDTFAGRIGRDANYYLDFSGANPIINFDSFDYLTYDRADNSFRVNIGGYAQATITGNGWLNVPSGLSVGASVVWHTGNDGSGSGLDADLLDGQDGSYYSNIPARLGYSPADRGGDSFTGPISIAYAGNAQISLNSTGVCIGRLVAQGDGNVAFYRNSGGGDVFVWGVASQSGPFSIGMPISRQGNAVWDAGNDGSGSGLDADMLDGFHASDLLRIISESKAGSGYMQLSNGLLLQWGRWTSSGVAGQALNITFPVAFSAEPYALVTMPVVTTSSGATTWSSDGITGSSFPARCSIASIGCRYFAIGPA